ncbi:hypothetical protein AAFF_G00298770 [Aldrovandia affinis]|uniref:Uncharacterized protein n=1 Tax=Aldrovandia affinis TaxID=143900 RepID=A0AAD7R991_9TELE|nr:hypothetical protein AAFF_G00298770 [Aldrovandia affinis]
MLDAIIRIRMHVQFQGKCCTDFKASERMLERFTSQNMYRNLEDRDDSEGGDPVTTLRYRQERDCETPVFRRVFRQKIMESINGDKRVEEHGGSAELGKFV